MTGTKRKYIIVGAEVDQPEAWLHKDGSISPRKGSDGEPLNVEYIGRLMVELSQRGKAGVPKAELDALEERVKRALVVQDFSVHDGGAALSDAEREAILNSTTVRIEFESRRRGSKKPDRNTRILVVPSDETLGIADAMLRAQGEAEGFRPPLSYELDRALMLAGMQTEILEMVREFAGKATPGWTPALQAALEAHMEEAIRERSRFKDGNGRPAKDVKNEIMSSPLRAFHRSVGIYATNMCR
ncbi:hypothetical protein NM680_05325 [Paracoccus sp. PS-1]|uniref:hypothetical protein n=1 Tax=unclassified Paracoccus (in: a-proteobacteria) TaxID=2688777 RepID=UPI00048F07F4|nr:MULTISPECIES: hypothetical protein [unclassified Paracoccus (in: a-proteobacteria)]MDQ7261219.1 hypothetical protein [Paracoccus sp. PS1]